MADFAIDADTRIVADYRIRKNISAFFDIDVFADVWGNARSQSGAEFLRNPAEGFAIRRRQHSSPDTQNTRQYPFLHGFRLLFVKA